MATSTSNAALHPPGVHTSPGAQVSVGLRFCIFSKPTGMMLGHRPHLSSKRIDLPSIAEGLSERQDQATAVVTFTCRGPSSGFQE